MIEIIPNWHPIFVHFTVALFSTAVGFYCLNYLMTRFNFFQRVLTQEFETVARWCLWVAALMSIATVLAGLYAYNTVTHDEVSHSAMTIHRNWAIATAVGIIVMALWSVLRYRKNRAISLVFLIGLLLVQGLLLLTAWRGAELVFRYGVGVLSLPQAEAVGDHHHHNDEANITATAKPSAPASGTAMKEHAHSDMDNHH